VLRSFAIGNDKRISHSIREIFTKGRAEGIGIGMRPQLARTKVAHFSNRYCYPSGSEEGREGGGGQGWSVLPAMVTGSKRSRNRLEIDYRRRGSGPCIPAARSQALEVSTAVAARNTARN